MGGNRTDANVFERLTSAKTGPFLRKVADNNKAKNRTEINQINNQISSIVSGSLQ